MRNILLTLLYMYMYMYIIDQEKKIKLFQKMPVRPSVRPCTNVMYTKTQERIKIIECVFFYLEGVSWESKLITFQPERTIAFSARDEWNFYFFFFILGSVWWNRFKLFYFKENTTRPDWTWSHKITEVEAELKFF